jgi:hypothetical protein
LRDIFLAIEGRSDYDREQWNRARYVGRLAIAPHVKKLPKLSDMAFDWERQKSLMPVEEAVKIMRKWDNK